MIEPRPEILDLQAYRPGRPAALAVDRVVNLAANENAWGPSPAARTAWRAWEAGARYPDMAGALLRDRLAARWGVPADNLLLGTGSGHLIKCLAETYLRPDDGVAMLFPTFSLYGYAAALMGAKSLPLPGDGHRVDFSALAGWVAEVSPRLVFLCSPNNPSGDTAPPAVIEDVLRELGPDGLLVIDEAYADFADSALDLARWMRQRRTLAVLRTLSKAYGLAGLRVGVLAADAAVVEAVGRVREPFPVSVPALAISAAAVDDEPYRRRIVEMVKDGRTTLARELTTRGWRVNPGEGNFVWAAPPTPGGAERLRGLLERRGILVRSGGSFGAPDHLRITVGRPEETRLLLQALDALTAGQGGGSLE